MIEESQGPLFLGGPYSNTHSKFLRVIIRGSQYGSYNEPLSIRMLLEL